MRACQKRYCLLWIRNYRCIHNVSPSTPPSTFTRHGFSFNNCIRYAFETQDERIARLTSKGLKKSALRKIPIVVYDSGSISTSFVATDCPICLGEFMDGEKVRVLPKCNHGFHVKCIDKWLLSHSSCPTCRQSLLEYPTSSEASSVAVIVAAAVETTNQRP
ncbi:RING-type E3 ubiquitin transferase [Trifolium repens]|nr:RING-type E3 ubiquitin transferase [Trifolium repens]